MRWAPGWDPPWSSTRCCHMSCSARGSACGIQMMASAPLLQQQSQPGLQTSLRLRWAGKAMPQQMVALADDVVHLLRQVTAVEQCTHSAAHLLQCAG